MEDPHHSPVGNASRLPQNVEVLQERGPVAIDVENAAAYPAIRILRRKPCFRKIQSNGVPSVFDDRDRVVEMAKSLPVIQPNVESPVDGHRTGGFPAANGPLVGRPDLAEVVIKY